MEVLNKILEFINSGSGSGSGSGYGYGYGYGSGSGYGSGDGSGYGDGSGVKSFCGDMVFSIDALPTIIDKVHGNIAKGRVLRGDLTTEGCYIIKQNGLFAHGDTLRNARTAIADKMFEGMAEEDRIDAFISDHKLGVAYPNIDLYAWHHRLTGSCDMGRRTFAEEHGIDVENGCMTVEEFIALTQNAYGGAVIRRLEARYKKNGQDYA